MTIPKVTGSKQTSVCGVDFSAPPEHKARHRLEDGGKPAMKLIAEHSGLKDKARRKLISVIKAALTGEQATGDE